MNLAAARAQLAAALDTVPGYTVGTRPNPTPTTGDGWVIVGPLRPSLDGIGRLEATLTAVLILGPDVAEAERRIETEAPALLHAVEGIPSSGVVLEPEALIVGPAQPGPLYALTLTLIVEVD